MYTVLNVTDDLTHCGHIGHVVRDFRAMCRLARDHGFGGVNIDLDVDRHIPLDEKRRILDDHRLRAVAFGLPAKIYSQHGDADFEASLPVFRAQAEEAHRLGCKIVIAYLPPFSNELPFHEYFVLLARRLAALRPTLERHDLSLALEFIGPVETRVNTRYDFIHTLDGTRSLIAAAGLHGRAGFKLDVHHWQNSGAGLLDLRHVDPSYLLYVELNDGLPGHDMFTMPEFVRELPLATGVTDVKGFLTALRAKGYAGPVAVEPWSPAVAALPLEDAVRAVKRAADRCLSMNL